MRAAFLMTLIVSSLGGCDWFSSLGGGDPAGKAAPAAGVQEMPPDPVVEDTLAAAAERASRASQAAAEVAIAEAGPSAAGGYSVPPGMDLPPELKRRFSVNWTGPLTALLKSLAMEVGYEFVVDGAPPAMPLTISLHRRDEPAWRILRDAGIAVSNAATVVLRPNARVIVLRHAWPVPPATSETETGLPLDTEGAQ